MLQPHDNKQRGLEVGEVAPQWNLKGLDGKLIGLFRYFGRPVLLMFFRGTWCESCRKQMEQIKADWQHIEPLVQVIGIVRENEANLRAYLAEHPLPFVLVSDPDAKIIQLHNVYQRFGLNAFRIAYPSTILLDRNHVVQYCYVGLSQFDRPTLDAILEEIHKLSVAK